MISQRTFLIGGDSQWGFPGIPLAMFDLMGFLRIYDGIPSGNDCYSLLFFKWPIEIVDLP